MLLAQTAQTAAEEIAQVWKFQAHPEVWVLLVGLASAYVYMIRVIGPHAVPNGPAVTRKQLSCFVAAMLVFWAASDWPIHEIGRAHV